MLHYVHGEMKLAQLVLSSTNQCCKVQMGSLKRKLQAAAAIQARWNKANGTNKVTNIFLLEFYTMFYITRPYILNNTQTQQLHNYKLSSI